MSSALAAALAAPPPSSPPLGPGEAPGGYWSLYERRSEPPDGSNNLALGAALFSLGAIRAAVGGMTVWTGRDPARCEEVVNGACAEVEIYGWTGVGLGALMLVTGVVYLGVGARQRARHVRWRRGELSIGPWMPLSVSRGSVGPRVCFAHPRPAFHGLSVARKTGFRRGRGGGAPIYNIHLKWWQWSARNDQARPRQA